MLAGLLTIPPHQIVLDEIPWPFPTIIKGINTTEATLLGTKIVQPKMMPTVKCPRLVLTRDPNEIIRSMAEKCFRFGREARELERPLAWAMGMAKDHMHGDYIVKYEDITQGNYPQIPGWSCEGDTSFWIQRAILAPKRKYEIERHGTKPTAIEPVRSFLGSVEAFRKTPEAQEFIKFYEKKFGYA